jgi:hypothetical protein
MPRPLKRGILGASTIILSKDINKYAFMCGSNFNETDVRRLFLHFPIKMALLSLQQLLRGVFVIAAPLQWV